MRVLKSRLIIEINNIIQLVSYQLCYAYSHMVQIFLSDFFGTMADQRHNESQANLTEALARFNLMESRVTLLEESVGRAVGTLMPKVDSLLSVGTVDISSESGSSSNSTTLPTSLLHLAEQGDGEALLQFLADELVHIQSSLGRTKDGDTALHVAASGGHVKAVVVLLGIGAKVNASGHRLRTPLHCAAAHGHLAVAQRLLLAGAQVDAKDADGHTPLGLAAGQGNKNLVVLLLQKGAKPNGKDVSVAGGNGYWDLVELFLQNGQSFVDSCNEEGDPLIVLAAKANRWEIIQMLLEKGASATKCRDSDTMAENIEEQASLTVAFARLDVMESRMTRLEESVNRAIETLMPKVDALLSGRTADSSESESCTSIASTLPTSIINLAEHGDAEALLELLAVEQVDFQSSTQLTENGDTALHVAASGGHVKAVVVLLGMGAKVNASGHRLRTPLHCAAAHGHLAVAQRLLLAGAQVDAKDADGHTPLGLAAGQGNKNLVVLLLQKGAKPNEKDVSVAGGNGNWDSVELFLQNEELFVDLCNKEGDPLIVLAAKANRWDMVQLLLEKGASATKCKVDEECALVWASQAGRADVVRELLRRGATKNAEQITQALTMAKSAAVVWTFVDVVPHEVRGRSGNFGLLQAACGGRLEPLVAFLEAGVNVNVTDGNNGTALYFAADRGHQECVRELVQRGADVNGKHSTGFTPLHRASLNGHVECVRALLEAGASTTERNNEGKTPLEVAGSDNVRMALTGGSE
ncbi:AAEL014742-PA [Gryllus bimaculatus]|nr:AAEL014742-PA [Gryllus bimaculatus]